MKNTNLEIDAYIDNGCGRCQYFATPNCKVNSWRNEIVRLRKILLNFPLNEELKWKIPCYTHNNHNVVLLSAFKDYCALSFANGALLKDKYQLLIKPGDHSQATRQLRFTSVKEIVDNEAAIKDYINQAIKTAQEGKKVIFKKSPEPMPTELVEKFKNSPALKSAFESLTPGRQRAYILFISSAKQAKTRIARIEKYRQKILDGKGINDD